MTKDDSVVPFKPQNKAASWENSFPAGSISGSDWILDVLDDLIAYCAANKLETPAIDLIQARTRIERTLRSLMS